MRVVFVGGGGGVSVRDGGEKGRGGPRTRAKGTEAAGVTGWQRFVVGGAGAATEGMESGPGEAAVAVGVVTAEGDRRQGEVGGGEEAVAVEVHHADERVTAESGAAGALAGIGGGGASLGEGGRSERREEGEGAEEHRGASRGTVAALRREGWEAGAAGNVAH